MKPFKKFIVLSLFCLGLFVLQKPLNAFAQYVEEHYQMLMGDWGSSGVSDSPIFVPEFVPADNPKYVCQWQLFDSRIYTNNDGKKFEKVTWAPLEFDTQTSFISSDDLKWEVAYVFHPRQGKEGFVENEITTISGEKSNLFEARQLLYLNFVENTKSSESEGNNYSVNLSIYLKQKVNKLLIGGSSTSTYSRTRSAFVGHARVSLSTTDESEKVYPLNTQIHCKKIN